MRSKKDRANVRVIDISSTVQTSELMRKRRQLVNKEITDATNKSIGSDLKDEDIIKRDCVSWSRSNEEFRKSRRCRGTVR
jgi:hypothetical protein